MIMKLQFRSLTIQNFKSFVAPAHIVLDRPGVTFLQGKNRTAKRSGSNGSGKSTIWDAMLWVLTGSTMDGLRNPDVVSWKANGQTQCSLLVEVNKKRHVITRSIDPNKIEIDHKAVGQADVDRLIRLPKEIIPYTVLIGQDQDLFFDLKPERKMELLSEVLNLDRWTLRSIVCRKKLSETQQALKELSFKIETLANDIIQRKKELTRLQALRDEFESTETKKRDHAASVLKIMKSELETAMHQFSKIDRVYESAVLEHNNLLDQKELLLDDISKAKERLDHYTDLSAQADVLEQSLKDEKCPTCGQSIHGERGADFRRKTRRKIDDMRNNSKINSKKYRNTLNNLKDELHEIDKSISKFAATIDSNSTTHAKLSSKIATLEANIHAKNEILDKPLENPYIIMVKDASRKFQSLKGDYEKFKDEKAIHKKLEHPYTFWVKGFKDIRLLLIEDTLQELQIVTDCMLDEFGLSGWEVSYGTEKETKSGTVKTGLIISVKSPESKKAIRWENWSGGERQRLRIIGTLALSKTLLNRAGLSTNLIAFDEPTRSLSTEGVEDLCALLDDHASMEEKSVWFIDHHLISNSHFTSVFKIEKTKEGSIIHGLD